MDTFSASQRSGIMSKVKGKDTKPELRLRSCLHRLGFRFRIQRKDLPGKPDIVLPKYKTVVFVNGCFWHRHEGCKRATTPQSNEAYWNKKFETNKRRDALAQTTLANSGWNVVIVWECELRGILDDPELIVRKILNKKTSKERIESGNRKLA